MSMYMWYRSKTKYGTDDKTKNSTTMIAVLARYAGWAKRSMNEATLFSLSRNGCWYKYMGKIGHKSKYDQHPPSE